MTFFYFDVSGQSAHIKVKNVICFYFSLFAFEPFPSGAPTTLGQLGNDRISDQLSHQFDLRSVRGNSAGVESLASL
jgi:hypothetical protein